MEIGKIEDELWYELVEIWKKEWMDFDMNWKGLKRLKVGDWNKCDRYMVIYDKDWKE